MSLRRARCVARLTIQVAWRFRETARLKSPYDLRLRMNRDCRCSASANLQADASSYPAPQLAKHELANHLHARFAVVETGNCGKRLAAIVPEDLGILQRNLFQRFQAIGGKARHHDCDAAHAVL